jgi:hypothetical protein
MSAAELLRAGAEQEPARCAYCDAAEVARRGDYCSPECQRLDTTPEADELLALEADFFAFQEA